MKKATVKRRRRSSRIDRIVEGIAEQKVQKRFEEIVNFPLPHHSDRLGVIVSRLEEIIARKSPVRPGEFEDMNRALDRELAFITSVKLQTKVVEALRAL